jgi:hypothetical protein
VEEEAGVKIVAVVAHCVYIVGFAVDFVHGDC